MKINFKEFLLCLLFVSLLISPALAENITFRASVDKNAVALDDAVNYTITFSGGSVNDAPNPTMPRLVNLTPVSQSQSSNISIINGQTNASNSYTYLLRPNQIGSASIGVSTVNIGGKIYQTDPIAIKVVKASGRVPIQRQVAFPRFFRSGAVTDPVLAKTSVSHNTAYVNQMIILTFTFYHRTTLFQTPMYILPSTIGFWTVNLPADKNQREATIKGVRYLAQDFKTALFPTTVGKLTIGSVTLSAQVDPFSPPLTLKTKPITVDVLPLPEKGRPADFSGVVGSYKLSAVVEDQKIERGKPFTLAAKIVGEGNLETISEPIIGTSEAFRKLSSSSKTSIIKGYDSVSGSKTFEIVLIPMKEGEGNLGPLSINYFDPQIKEYRELRSESFKINVLSSSVPLPKEIKEDARRSELKINFDGKTLLKKLYKFVVHPYFQFSFWGLLIVFSSWRGIKKIKSRRNWALKAAKNRIKKAKKLLRPEKLKDFTAEIYDAVIHYLGDQFNFSSAGITTDQLREILSDKGLSPELQREIADFMGECDRIRFTPALLDKEKAGIMMKAAEKIIGEGRC